MANKIAAGNDIDFKCTRCKMVLAHTIIAVVNGNPARVKCNTCHTERKWRATKSAKSSGPVKRSRVSKTKKTNATSSVYEKQTKWKALMEIAVEKKAERLPYSFRETYKQGQILDHKKFGEGVIEELVADNKILVCFLEGDKLLIHGRK